MKEFYPKFPKKKENKSLKKQSKPIPDLLFEQKYP